MGRNRGKFKKTSKQEQPQKQAPDSSEVDQVPRRRTRSSSYSNDAATLDILKDPEPKRRKKSDEGTTDEDDQKRTKENIVKYTVVESKKEKRKNRKNEKSEIVEDVEHDVVMDLGKSKKTKKKGKKDLKNKPKSEGHDTDSPPVKRVRKSEENDAESSLENETMNKSKNEEVSTKDNDKNKDVKIQDNGEVTEEVELRDEKEEDNAKMFEEELPKSLPTPERRQQKSIQEAIDERILHETEDSILLQCSKTLTLCGKVYVSAVKGTIQINGFQIAPDGKNYRLYSPNCNALLSITVTSTEGTYLENIDSETAKEKVLNGSEDCAVVKLSRMDSATLDFVTGIEPNCRIFESPGGYALPSADVFVVGDGEEAVKVGDEHTNAADSICKLIKQGGAPIVMLCGGKNLGKSTFCRYILNRALSSGCKRVGFLDCDVGQTEFTPSSMVSLTLVEEPLLGPPFTHAVWPHRAAFYGDATPANDPARYLHCLNELYEAYSQLPEPVPLIVNTMGWNRGLGLNLFVDTLRLVKATHIIQLCLYGHKSRNFPVMNQDCVNALDGWSSPARSSSPSAHGLIEIQSYANLEKEGHARLTPKDHRNLMFFSYFGRSSVLSAVPYEVPWSAITVDVVCSEVHPAQVMYALNASVVALCTLTEDQIPADKNNVKDAPRFVNTAAYLAPHCHGLGIIRGIDPERKVFYVMSPLPLEKIKQVNCFVKGALEVPQQMFMNQKIMESLPGTIPYFGESRATMGATAVVRRRHMQRGRRNKDT